MKRPRIICIGSNLESQVALDGLLANDANVVATVTRPTARAGSISDYADLHPVCQQHGISTIDTVNINSSETLDAIRRFAPDYLYTLGWSQLFSDQLLAIPQHYAVGSHPSPLPVGRGRAPAPWTILEGLTESAVTLFRMDCGVDAGELLLQKWFSIAPEAYVGDLYQTIAENLRAAFVELYSSHCSDKNLVTIPQDESKATHRAKRSPPDGWIDFHLPAQEISRLIRAVSQPFPGAYAYFQNRKTTIWHVETQSTPAYIGKPGQVLAASDSRLLVQTGDQPIWLSDFEQDSDLVSCQEFKIGSTFGYRVEDELSLMKQQLAELRQEIVALKAANSRSAA